MSKISEKSHKNTDKRLADLNKRLKRLYSTAYASISAQIIITFSKMDFKAGMTATERYAEANKYGRLAGMEKIIAKELNEVNKAAVNEINGMGKNTYRESYEAVAQSVFEKTGIKADRLTANENADGINEAVSPFDAIALDKFKDRNILHREAKETLVREILRGSDVSAVKAALKDLSNKELNNAARIAVTTTTRIENAGRLDAMKDAKDKGAVIIKQWTTMADEKVRDAHARADGQQADVERNFYVGGERLRYPGDAVGSAKNVINCRCYIEEIVYSERMSK